MKTKAALSLSLALLTALSSLCACGGTGSQGGGPEGDVPSGGAAQTEETTESPLAAIPAADYGGHVFRFIHDENSDLWYDSTLYAGEMTGAVLDDTVYERNHYVSEKLNIDIQAEFSNEALKKVSNQVQSGSYDYDVSYLHLNDAFNASFSGVLLNLYSVGGFDLEAPWWDHDAIESFTFLPGKCWFANTDLNTNILGGASIIIFNSDMRANYGLDDFYQLVKDHKWTLSKMYEQAKTVNSDVNGDGKQNEGDIFGIAAGMGNYAMTMSGANEKFVDLDEDYRMIYRVAEPSFIEAADLVARMFNDKLTTTIVNDQTWSDENFKNGNALFYLNCSANSLVKMSQDVGFIYGVLPSPLRAEDQERYISAYASYVTALSLPLTQEDPDRTAAVINALSIYSHEYLTDAYYDTTLIGKCARDENTETMLDLIFAGCLYDYALIFSAYTGNAWPAFFDNVKKNGAEGLASLWEKNHEKVEKAWDKAMAAFESN